MLNSMHHLKMFVFVFEVVFTDLMQTTKKLFQQSNAFAFSSWFKYEAILKMQPAAALPMKLIQETVPGRQRPNTNTNNICVNFSICQILKFIQNIARGTTDPEIDSVTWIKFSHQMSHLRWHHLHLVAKSKPGHVSTRSALSDHIETVSYLGAIWLLAI